jgi:hypothetical protein
MDLLSLLARQGEFGKNKWTAPLESVMVLAILQEQTTTRTGVNGTAAPDLGLVVIVALILVWIVGFTLYAWWKWEARELK